MFVDQCVRKVFQEATMATLLETLNQQFSPDVVKGMSQKIGADEAQTQQALSALLPMMVGGLAKNTANNPEGSAKLSQVLERDHDGSLLDQMTSNLSRADMPSQQAEDATLQDLGARGLGEPTLGGLMNGGSSSSGNMLSGLLGGNAGNMLSGLFGGSSANPRSTNVTGILSNVLGGQNVTPVQQGVSQATGLESGKVGSLMAMLAPMVMGALGKVKRQDNLDSEGLARVLENDRQDIEKQVPEASGISKFLDSNRDGKIDMKDDIAKVGIALGGAMLLGGMRKR
jgi:Bacterial protein of unknown function (DUF937)